MRTIPMFLLTGVFAATLVGNSGCSSDNLEELSGKASQIVCNGDTSVVATYSGVVRPIIQTNCLRCHSTGGIGTNNSGYNFETATGIKVAVTDGRLIGAIEHRAGFDFMPKDIKPEKIPACDIVRIKQWVRRGSPND